MIKAILTDIEGTTSSISFVKDVLFPYARARLPAFVRAHAEQPNIRALLDEVSALHGTPLNDEQTIAELIRWIDEDRKATPLKALQGLIWEAGYRDGDYRGHIYPDAARKLKEWKAQGLALYVYSSGSVHAQKLLFAHTECGDLTPLFSGYFDTQVGAKQADESYQAIARHIGLPPIQLLFLSDIGAELDAAKSAGFTTCQLLREGATPSPAHPQAIDFDAVVLN